MINSDDKSKTQTMNIEEANNIIKELILELKRETHLDFICEDTLIKRSKYTNMWYDSESNTVIVSAGMLVQIARGYFNKDDIKIILYHELGHASKEPRLLAPIEWLYISDIIGTLIILVLGYIGILSFYSWFLFILPVVFIVLTLFLCYLRREWERVADNYVFNNADDRQKIKSTFKKLWSHPTKLGILFHKKPFYYFGFGLTSNERLKNLENFNIK